MSNYFFTASVNYSENKKCFKTRVYSCNERTRKKKKKKPAKNEMRDDVKQIMGQKSRVFSL